MKKLLGKIAFIHRTLWQRNPTYRWAALLGPPPLLGCALAALALAAWTHVPHETSTSASNAPWAHWTRPIAQDDQPYTEPPTAPLPKTDAAGRLIGLQPGWIGEIRPATMDATMDIDIKPTSIASFKLDSSTVGLAAILDAAPPNGSFVGAAKTFFIVHTAGLYAFSAQLTWLGAQSANCMVRLNSPHHRLIRQMTLNTASKAVLNYPPTSFRLEPGLLMLQTAIGCWRGEAAMAPGTLTLMIRRPGEPDLTPATADELMRPAKAVAIRLH